MSLNGHGPFNSREFLHRRFRQQPENTPSQPDTPTSETRRYRVDRTQSSGPPPPTTSPSPQQRTQNESFFTSLDDLNRLIEAEQQRTVQAQNNPYNASLNQLEKLDKLLDKGTIPAIRDIQFEGFGQVNPASAEGQDLNYRLNQFLQRLSRAGKGGKLRARQIKLTTELDLLNAQKAFFMSALNNLPQGDPRRPDLESRLAAIEIIAQRNQTRLDRLDARDPSKGGRISQSMFNNNDRGNPLSATTLYNRARKWAMKILGRVS